MNSIFYEFIRFYMCLPDRKEEKFVEIKGCNEKIFSGFLDYCNIRIMLNH